jgi:hypothetical protein
VLLQAGASAAPTVFLFSDSQMKHESFLEDINNVLNTGAGHGSVFSCTLPAHADTCSICACLLALYCVAPVAPGHRWARSCSDKLTH